MIYTDMLLTSAYEGYDNVCIVVTLVDSSSHCTLYPMKL